MNRNKSLAKLRAAAVVAYTALMMLPLSQAHASGGIPGDGTAFAPTDTVTAKECGACHQAYGPELMPQGAWSQLMGNLSNHFGEDASLDEQTRNHIEQYLLSKAERGTGPVRITEQRWFSIIHFGGNSEMFNCNSCHR